MSKQPHDYAFVSFTIVDEAAFDRLVAAVEEFRLQKEGDANAAEAYWLNFFDQSDRSNFWWPTEAELQLWNKFWFSTPLPDRHGPSMPSPPWDFGSMIDAILDAEYEIVGVSRLDRETAKLEFDSYPYPYGGIDSLRALIRAFGHTIIGFDDGTGFVGCDPQSPRWNPDMLPN